MRIVVALQAQRDLARQLQYLIDNNAGKAARKLEQRLVSFVEATLTSHPRVGRFLQHRNLWETWIPGTRLVYWYRFTAKELQIVRNWHCSQDRDAP